METYLKLCLCGNSDKQLSSPGSTSSPGKRWVLSSQSFAALTLTQYIVFLMCHWQLMSTGNVWLWFVAPDLPTKMLTKTLLIGLHQGHMGMFMKQ